MKKILRTDFSKNVFRLMTGTTISQMIPFITMPILSRLYTPEEFGLYAFYISIISLLVVFSTGRYELAIPLPKKHTNAWQILLLSFTILTVYSSLILGVLILFKTQISNLLNRTLIDDYLYFIPLFVFLTGSYNIFTMWMHRLKLFATAANSKIHLNLWENSVNLVMGFIKNGVSFNRFGAELLVVFSKKNIVLSCNSIGFGGLLLGRLFGLIISIFYFLIKLRRNELKNKLKIDKLKLISFAKEYKDFPKINMFHAATDELKNSGLSFTILYFFMDKTLGIYNQAYRLLRAPLGIIGAAFGHVFFQKAAELSYNKEPISDLIFSTIKKLFWIALPLFIVIFSFSPWFFTFFLGENWTEVGVYAQYMTPWLFVNFIFSPVSHVSLVLGKQFQFWMINLLSSVLVFTSMIVAGFVFNDIKVGLIIISITQIIYSIYLYRWLVKIARNHDCKVR